MNEFEFLVQMLENIAEKPQMYGNPEEVEYLSKHVTHVCLSIALPEWTFDMTEKFWGEVSITLLSKKRFAPTIYEHDSYQQEKWGEGKEFARLQVLQAYQSIWLALKSSHCRFHPFISQWIESLLRGQLIIGNPDTTAMVLRSLLGFALDEACYQKFLTIYQAVCIQIKGFSSRGLLDVGTKPEWVSPPLSPIVELEPAFAQIKIGLAGVIKYLDTIS